MLYTHGEAHGHVGGLTPSLRIEWCLNYRIWPRCKRFNVPKKPSQRSLGSLTRSIVPNGPLTAPNGF